MENSNPTIDQTLFDLKLNEAQFYFDQGLYEEADKIYLDLINELKKLPNTKNSSVQIRQLEAMRKEYQNEIVKDNSIPKLSFNSNPDKFNDYLNDDVEFSHKIELQSNSEYSYNKQYIDDCISSDIDNKVHAFINDMIIEAFKKSASYIYIEPSINSDTASVRFRIDSICKPYRHIPNKFALKIVFKIKLMANMDITMRGKPIYGKIKFKSAQTGAVTLQAIAVPTIGSKEEISLKFFPTAKLMDITALGLLKHNLEPFMNVIAKPSGLIIISGLSDSGKTTTLNCVLNMINSVDKKIYSAEKQIAIIQKQICQTEVQPEKGFDYPQLMKAFIDSKADVISLEEIDNYETASVAIKTALSGYLIFGGINASTVSDSVKKVVGMGIEPTFFADSLLCILSQKLIKRLCEKCRLPVATADFMKSGECIELVDNIYQDKIEVYEHSPFGCDECGHTGYKGRVAIHELLINNNSVKSLIKSSVVQHDSSAYGIYTFKQDGLIKVLKGITDIAEVKLNCL